MRVYRGLRRDVSLLLASGHPGARRYPIAVVWSESRIIRQRESQRMQKEAILMQSVIASMFAEDGGKQFGKLLRRVDDVG